MWVKSNGNLFNLSDVSAIMVTPFYGSLHPGAKTKYSINILYQSGQKLWTGSFYDTQEAAEEEAEKLFNFLGAGIERYEELTK
jgi:hypothetical protein